MVVCRAPESSLSSFEGRPLIQKYLVCRDAPSLALYKVESDAQGVARDSQLEQHFRKPGRERCGGAGPTAGGSKR